MNNFIREQDVRNRDPYQKQYLVTKLRVDTYLAEYLPLTNLQIMPFLTRARGSLPTLKTLPIKLFHGNNK